ncbi:SRPBCC family protein [Flagellimonas onchidii]|uniref:SRPBCC family protein n=1 Tax=Flagellimonas onchidii TaxID=2562684 RepID=UPI0010A5C200|nr:SRPBCC domain-containing protein [Allomuricauda onchidii]
MTNNVYLERIFDCSIEELFQWFSKPDLIAQWFGPKHLKVGKVNVNFNIGGTYSIELRKEHGNSFHINGIYTEIQKPIKIVFNLRYQGLTNPPPDSIVNIMFQQINPYSTKLLFVQKFDVPPPDFENRTKAWESMFERLFQLAQ